MPTATVQSRPQLGSALQLPPASGHHHVPGRVWLVVIGALLLAVLTAGVWLFALGSNETTSESTPAGTSLVLSTPELSLAGGVEGLQLELRAAGYSLAVTGVLDPVTRSAAGNYLRPTPSSPLDPVLATVLDGTVITGVRDPAAWNARFGVNRATRRVERPLTGPGGQLDAQGNLTG